MIDNKERIIEIHSLSTLSDWYFDNISGDNLSEYEPAVCLALITTINCEHGWIEKKAVALKSEDLENLKVGEFWHGGHHDDLITLEALKVRFE